MVLDTRDIKDSATIFGFIVSNHKKSNALLKKFRPDLKKKKILRGGGAGVVGRMIIKCLNIVIQRSHKCFYTFPGT